ncbi:MAG: TonB-dependent receptor [Bacteroidetes bacterium]|nr:TonB-dependent receptor [Bacteroidota bacterium]
MRKYLLVCLSFVLAIGTALAQERSVTGRVTASEDGAALPGVNIVIKGTTSGTVTDSEGKYSLSVPSDGGTLVFSFVGFATQEIAIGSRSVVDVALEVDAKQLSEVIVTGYGTQEKRKMTTAIASVSGSAISSLATPSFVDQLGGRAAGVQVTIPTGIIGQAPTINIRGVNSISSGTFPLVVVDGVPIITGNQSSVTPMNPLADINPADIESYEVLKDGAAAAIYGSRAANGVILITTKRGTKAKGTPKVDFQMTTGFSEPVKRFDLANASEFETIANQKLTNAGAAPSAFSDPTIATSGSTDWQKYLFRKGKFSSYNINLSGASESTNYYFSVGYQKQESNVIANDYERFSFRNSLDHRFNKFLKFGITSAYTRGVTNGLNTGTNALSGNIAGGIRAFPNVTVYDINNPTGYNISSDGQALGPGANTRAITSSWTNQGFVLANNKFLSTSDRLQSTIYGQADIIEGLALKTQFGVDYLGNKDFQRLDPRHGDGRGSNGFIFNQFRTLTRWNWQNTLAYNKDFGKHNFDAVVGLEYQKTVTEAFNGQGTSFSDRFFMANGLISGSYANQFSGGTYSPSSFQSTFGRLNYSYSDKYLLGFSIRRDGISDLDANNRYGTFWGVSAGWRISQEDFFINSSIGSVVNSLKIRGSYATVGNTSIGSFPYAGLYGSAKYGTQNGVGFTQAGNDQLIWETSKKTDIGADFGFLNNKITMTVDWFQNDIDGNILSVPYAPSLGIPGNAISQNIGTLRNTGIEFSVTATAMKRNGFTWDISANYTSVNNQVIKTFPNAAGLDADVGVGAYQITARVGQPLNVLYGYTYYGVNSANGYPMYVKGNGTLVQRNVATGTYSIYDSANPTSETNTTGAALNPADISAGGDRQVLGRTIPTWYGGLTNTFNYKNFTLEIFMRYSGGNKVYNQTRQDVMLNMDFTNSSRELLNSWTPENTGASLPKMYINQNAAVNQSGQATTRFVEDGSFLRIQNIILGYSLPKSILGKGEFKLTNVRIFAQVQNAFTITGYKGIDPELGALNANGSTTGIDNNVNPLNRTYTLGINIGF